VSLEESKTKSDGFTRDKDTMSNDAIKDILRRLDRLEKALPSSGSKRTKKATDKDFAGPSGGVRLLHSRGFFKVKRNVGAV
jgi:hypothetical protein